MKDLFRKLIDNTISKEEYDQLMDLLKTQGYSEEIEQGLDDVWANIGDSENHNDGPELDNLDRVYPNIMNRIRREDNLKNASKKNMPQVFLKVAAVLAIVFSSILIYKEVIGPANGLSQGAGLPENAITLTLGNGNVTIIEEGQEQQIRGAQGSVVGAQIGNKLVYGSEQQVQASTEEAIYNTLTVPYGKRFDLELSDGSLVKLNAGSSIRYPIKFIAGQHRKVFLDGEAYFDIAKDKAHPFVVNANTVDIEVLGTEFNVSYYPEDAHINTVLVEGSVKLNSDGSEAVFLTPGQLGQWDKQNKNMTVKKVETDIYTAWKDGVLLFKRASFSNIKKKLERYFDVTIENNNALLGEQMYTASFTNESLFEVLEVFKEDFPFEYEVLGEKIRIKPLNNQQTKLMPMK
jgi:ferric-dicitrate binding protein FerR (iron transport regulator)